MSQIPSAVVAANDLAVVGVIKRLTSVGLRIQNDISVTGFDKTWLAECNVPSLTTVHTRRNLLGQNAVDALHALCSSLAPQGREYEISTELAVGQLSGKPILKTKTPSNGSLH